MALLIHVFAITQCACCLLASGAHLKLPSFESAKQDLPAELVADKSWWARVGERIYHKPETSSPLSPRIQDYFYAFGSEAALPDVLKDRRVGGEGRVHIFHLPEGVSLLQSTAVTAVTRGKSRRDAISSLFQLTDGAILSTNFPQYKTDHSYANPLTLEGQQVERTAVNALSEADYLSYLQGLVGLGTRSFSNSQATVRAVEHLEEKLRDLGYQTCRQPYTASGMNLFNVMTRVPGSTGKVVVIGAHYDSRPYEGDAPGAEDNGSGVAALLAIAKAFKAANVKPESDIYFVFWGGEEIGLTGSAVFAAELEHGGVHFGDDCKPHPSFVQLGHTTPAEGAIQAIVMDEVGWKSPRMVPTVNLESYDNAGTTHLMNHMAAACIDANGDKLAIVHNNHPFGSDHMSFLDRSRPAVLAINGDDEAYPNYHQSTDTIENVDIPYGVMIAKMNLGALLRTSGVETGGGNLLRTVAVSTNSTAPMLTKESFLRSALLRIKRANSI